MKKASKKAPSKALPFVIVRCTDAGVHAGELVAHSGQSVSLRNSRRLWQWRVPMGAPAFLSGVASHGISASESRVGCPVDVVLLDACEILTTTEDSQKSITEASSHVRTI